MNRYDTQNNCIYRIDQEGNRDMLCNFDAFITFETHHVDGENKTTYLTIEGLQTPRDNPDAKEPIQLPPIEIAATDFNAMSWIMPNWGVRCLVMPGQGIKDDLRAAIQAKSRPEQRIVYRHLGWTTIDKQPAYIHAGGAITADADRPDISVKLPTELLRYDLTDEGQDLKEAIRASIRLASVSESKAGWALLAGSLAPILGPVDFGIHVTGRTGTFKSELMSLFQSHYGSEMDARHLPGSWSSTANALEAQAYFAKNAAFVIDDFVPIGTSWQVRAYQTTADKIIRAQGNQSGRARLTDTSNLQQTYYPRGIVLSTGEDTPEGHSVRARMLILELSPGDIPTDRLSSAQTDRHLFPKTTAEFIRWVATDQGQESIDAVKVRAQALRNQNLTIGHTRTPAMLGRLIATVELFLDWAHLVGGISGKSNSQHKREAREAILEAGNQQMQHLEAADPCDQFIAGIRQLFGAGLGHVRTLNGGIPLKADVIGWTKEEGYDEMPRWKSHGPCIGWINWETDELMIDITAGYNLIRKAIGNEMTLTKQTLFKRLKDAGFLTRSDENRQRNTVRVTAENHPRQVVALAMSRVIESQEVPQDEQREREPGDDDLSPNA